MLSAIFFLGVYAHKMRAILVAWTLPDTDKTTSSALAKVLYGQRTSSHNGKYVHWRRGFLDDIPYVKLIRGAFIVKKEDAGRVTEFLLDHGVRVYLREVKLTESDKRVLSKPKTPPSQQTLLGYSR